ncbi:hypothetical protein Barb6_02655 [Bacteroidales bacterium Barb6]|nr:hypothetical protein Barb6_02655 [Bacteroidales bacterium Barb6]
MLKFECAFLPKNHFSSSRVTCTGVPARIYYLHGSVSVGAVRALYGVPIRSVYNCLVIISKTSLNASHRLV